MITQIPNYESLTPQEIVAYLTESVGVPTNRVITVATLVETLGMEAAGLVAGTIKAAGNPIMDSVFLGLSTTGILLGPDRQPMVDMLAVAGSWPDSVRDAVKALGGSMVPRWESLGYQNEPTIESIQVELNGLEKLAIVNAARSSINAKATAINAWLDVLEVDGMTVENVTEYVARLLASDDGNPP